MGCVNKSIPTDFDLQGHRGCRGLMPENSIPGFIKALELGVKTLEMDVVISSDNKVVLSHDPYFSADICLQPDGQAITDEKEFPVFRYTYNEIKQFDCGSLGNTQFPQQEKISLHKPLLNDVIRSSEAFSVNNKLPLPWYNIETKSTPAGDNLLHPAPAEFVKLLYDVLETEEVKNRSIIQSFDLRTLQEMHKLDASVKLAILIETNDSPEENIKSLGFTPDIYSPHYSLVNKELIRFCKEHQMKLIPWTVNTTMEMQHLINMGVDGIITDYPNLFPNKEI